MDPRRRQELTRYGAPAAFLAAATIAVLLIKAGLDDGSTAQRTTVRPLPKATATIRPTTTKKKLVLTAPPATASTGSTTATTATTSATATTSTTATTATTSTTATTTPGAQYYVIQSGDTLGSIAQKYGTTVEKLMALNPGVDPTALRIGQRIRVS